MFAKDTYCSRQNSRDSTLTAKSTGSCRRSSLPGLDGLTQQPHCSSGSDLVEIQEERDVTYPGDLAKLQ